ncbi:MAG: TfoX/Sxy family protein [Bacteroidetes bacterium]|nr:TfoX/Sxy family protein [Bacteroidota bacterium]
MAYDTSLADRIRAYLMQFPKLKIQEKKMFRGLAFIINEKMCINVSGDNLMCRFDPGLTEEIVTRKGFLPMIMKGKEYKGYCYVEPTGFKNNKDFEFWINLCLDFNDKAKSSKKQT